MAFQSLVEGVVKLGLAPALCLYMVWYFTRQFDRLVSANERTSRAVDRIARHLDLPVEEDDTPQKTGIVRKKRVSLPVSGGVSNET